MVEDVESEQLEDDGAVFWSFVHGFQSNPADLSHGWSLILPDILNLCIIQLHAKPFFQ